MIGSILNVFTTLALAAPLPHYAAPVIEARFDGAPEGFQVMQLHTDWRWHDDPSELTQLGPSVSVDLELDIQLPVTWELKSFKSGSARLQEVKKSAKTPGLWHLKGNMDTASATADVEFVDERKKVFKLDLTLRTKSRHPYVLIKAQCPNYPVRLDPGVAHGNFLYLIVTCHEFGDDVTLYFAHSPDGKWIGSNIIKDPKKISFEHKFQKAVEADRPDLDEKAPTAHHLFDLRTEDSEGKRAEYGVFVTEED